MASFAVEVDHVFVSASVGAPEAQRLIDLGLVEGSRNRHPGQGTANRRFFFANAMLELIWVENEAEARSEDEPARRLHLWERWSGRDGRACPFGVCLRPRGGQSDVAPFPAWEYRPAYAPVGMSMLAALRNGAFSFEPAAQPLLELGFDGERSGQRADLRPDLPLVLLW